MRLWRSGLATSSNVQPAEAKWWTWRGLATTRCTHSNGRQIEGQRANVIPAPDGTVDFFYLFDMTAGRLVWQRPGTGLKFAYQFDTKVFPYAWMFASYGGFNGCYTVILEPCTAMPISVNEAASKRQCSVLNPGETLVTQVSIWVGSMPQAGTKSAT